MLEPPIPSDDEQRVDDLHQLHLMLTTPDEAIDAVATQLTQIFAVAGAAISFVDQDTQYYKSAVGLPLIFPETRTEPRELSVCSHVVGSNEMLIVEDLQADERFCDNPIVREAGVRFYAGAPLRADSGRAVGSICIVDTEPGTISRREAELLHLLAGGVMAQVKLQVASRNLLQHALQTERDLRDAARVQRFLLPPAVIEGDGWQVEHLYRPAARLCGDFLDVHRREDGCLAILIADVCGHGASAALTSAMVKIAFLRAAPNAPSPAALLNVLQRELHGMAPPGRFISAIAALFAPHEQRIELASAGHLHPLLVTDAGVEVMNLNGGMVLLVSPDTEYEHGRSVMLSPGDRLFLYTDGATEASNGNGERLDVDGLSRLAAESADDRGDAFVQTLFERIDAHAANQLHDDVTLLAVCM
jgi:serine phosphatase RsbU (regulator of sigma subunit)